MYGMSDHSIKPTALTLWRSSEHETLKERSPMWVAASGVRGQVGMARMNVFQNSLTFAFEFIHATLCFTSMYRCRAGICFARLSCSAGQCDRISSMNYGVWKRCAREGGACARCRA